MTHQPPSEEEISTWKRQCEECDLPPSKQVLRLIAAYEASEEKLKLALDVVERWKKHAKELEKENAALKEQNIELMSKLSQSELDRRDEQSRADKLEERVVAQAVAIQKKDEALSMTIGFLAVTTDGDCETYRACIAALGDPDHDLGKRIVALLTKLPSTLYDGWYELDANTAEGHSKEMAIDVLIAEARALLAEIGGGK